MASGDRAYGRRVDPEPKPGDYGPGQGTNWWAVAPRASQQTTLPANEVTVHDDGTISAAPNNWTGTSWRGVLDHGIWIES